MKVLIRYIIVHHVRYIIVLFYLINSILKLTLEFSLVLIILDIKFVITLTFLEL